MSFLSISTPFNVDIEFEIAPLYKRLAAYLIDLSLLFVYLLSMLYLLFGGFEIGMGGAGFVLIVVLIPMLLYTLLMELWMDGQTLGKKILGIKVISLDGGEPHLEQYLLRWFLRFYEWGSIISICFRGDAGWGIVILSLGGILSIIIMIVSSKSQRLGDLAAGTVLVNTRSRLSVHDTIFMNISQPDYKVRFPEVMRLSDRDINTIKSVLQIARKNHKYDMINKVAAKVKEVLKLSNDMYSMDFLEKILEDYNYLSTRE